MRIFIGFIAFIFSSWALTHTAFDEQTTVIGEQMDNVFDLVLDPKAPRQPIPSFDASGYLKTVPGFTVARKGSSGGDISLRGLAGSRILIINDGQQMGGTCGGRMDPPTNYITPQNYDQVDIIKGPQTVQYGPTGSAGTIVFSRDHYGLTGAGFHGVLQANLARFNRKDLSLSTHLGQQQWYLLFDGSGSKSDDYKDGDGKTMRSAYERYSFQAALGRATEAGQVLELSLGFSDGNAYYADRNNHASKIGNHNGSILVKQPLSSEYVSAFDFQLYANENDHIMDQFYRHLPVAIAPMGSNPKRFIYGFHLITELTLWPMHATQLGFDGIHTEQKNRQGKTHAALMQQSFESIYEQQQWGIFLENEADQTWGTWVSGIRADFWQTDLLGSWRNQQENQQEDWLYSLFTRLEWPVGEHQLTAGIGYTARPADYWEIMKAGKMLNLATEKTLQLDTNWQYYGVIDLTLSMYAARVEDYILIDQNTQPSARNIDVNLAGFELGLAYDFTAALTSLLTLTYSYGENTTDQTPLGQVSPFEARLSIDYNKDNWNVGLYNRWVQAQNRVSLGTGNIVSVDLGKSSSFNVLAINASYQAFDSLSIQVGVDNLLDEVYAEHISRSAADNQALPLSDRTKQVNEPGRTYWLSLDYYF